MIADGLPDAGNDATRLVITGAGRGSTAVLRSGSVTIRATADATGTLTLDIPAGFDLAEATLVIEHEDGTVTRITSADEFRDGALALDLEFGAVDGEPAGAATVRVFGSGFVVGSDVDVSMHSTPVHLTTLVADTTGAFDQWVTLPATVEAGEHRVVVNGSSADGPVNAAWHFAVDAAGAVERVGDPEPEAGGAGGDQGAPGDAAVADAAAAEAALLAATTASDAGDAGTGEIARGDAPIDEATGLAEYAPTDEPEETVAATVEAFALLSMVGAGGSLLAASMTSMPSAGTVGAVGTGAAASRSGRAGGAGRDEESRRGKGKLATGKAAKFGDGVEGNAWGDGSRTWRWPLTDSIDRIALAVSTRIHRASPLAARVVADGSTMRAALGSGSVLAPVTGALLGVAAAVDTGGHPVAPSLTLMFALIVLGVFDSFSGFVAATAFGVAVALSGGIESADSVRALLGVGSIWFAIPLIAAGARAFRRPPAESAADRWHATADVVMGSLLAAWSIQSVVSSLPGLSGLSMPIAERADLVAVVVVVALVARYCVERLAVRLYPERLAAVTFVPAGKPGTTQQVASNLVKAGVFVFVILPYLGFCWQLWAVVAMMVVPSLAGPVKDRFPNSGVLHRTLPRGVPNTLVMMTVGTVLGASLGERITDPASLLVTSFLVLSIPGFVLSVLGLFGRESAAPRTTWVSRLAGAGRGGRRHPEDPRLPRRLAVAAARAPRAGCDLVGRGGVAGRCCRLGRRWARHRRARGR